MRAVLRRYHGRARRACAPYGAIAQLGERLDRTQEVAGSSPASSIGLRLATPVFRSAIPPECAFPPPRFPSSRNDTRALAREHWSRDEKKSDHHPNRGSAPASPARAGPRRELHLPHLRQPPPRRRGVAPSGTGRPESLKLRRCPVRSLHERDAAIEPDAVGVAAPD